MAHELIHNIDENKYEYHIDGHIAYIQYDEKDGVLALTHTIVPDVLAGKGLARELLEDVLSTIEHNGKKAAAQCSYIVKYQEKHPENTTLV